MAFLDNFTGTAGTKLTARTGWTQVGYGSGSQIPEINATNQLRAASASDDVPLVGQNAGNTDHYVQANVSDGFGFTSGAAFPQLMVRATTRGDSFGAGYSTSLGAWVLVRDNTSIAASMAQPFVSGDLVRIEAEGSNIRVLVNGVEIIDHTATDHLSNTYVGILVAGTAGSDPVLDNYESGLLAAVPASTAAFNTRTIDGQTVTYTFTTTNAPNAGNMTLTATSGGPTQGPSGLSFGNGTATVTFTGVPAGTYTESGSVNGAGGGGSITGLGTLTMAGIDGAPADVLDAPTSTVTGVTISPGTATGSGTFTATVNGSNSPSQAVTWSASAGSITSGGVFTAPLPTSSVQTITITATSVQDGTKSGTATVTIAALALPTVTGVVVSPGTATGSAAFSALVAGTNSPSQAVTWSTTGGTISSSGIFTAPDATTSLQTITVTATSVADPSKSGMATVTIAAVVNPPPPPPPPPPVGQVPSVTLRPIRAQRLGMQRMKPFP